MFAVLHRSRKQAPAGTSAELPPASAGSDTAQRAVIGISQRISALGREAAEVRGVLDDTHKTATAQAAAVQALAQQLQEVLRAQAGIGNEVDSGLQSVARVGNAVQAVGDEVAGIIDTLKQVSGAAQEITQVALQTRLVAFNASVEAKRAGDAGRGFGVVADAVKDLAAQVERSSKSIMGTVTQLGTRIDALSRDFSRDGPLEQQGAVHQALASVEQGVQKIHDASNRSREVCKGLDGQMGTIEGEIRRTTTSLDDALQRTEGFLRISEQLIETVAECGVETPDTPFIRGVQQAAAEVSALLEQALQSGAIDVAALFDEAYQAVPGSDPAQVTTRFVALAESIFPQVQERMLALSDKVVFCIAADRNGYIACHNKQYNQPQRAGDVLWNTAHCRNRRIFNDRTGLASARNQRPFLLQTYRRDMGGGQFVTLKEAAAPIRVADRHWGGLRLAFKF
jgi:methyl-accepting chemotaxis protein